MGNVNDCKLFQLTSLFGSGNLNDLFREWLALSTDWGQVSSMQMTFLDNQNVPAGHIDDRWFYWLGTQGVTDGSLSDRWKAYWCLGGTDGTVIPKLSKMVDLPLLTDLYGRGMSPDATFARNSIATVTDFEGNVKTVKVDEARFQDTRRVENLVPTADLTDAVWTKTRCTVTDNGDSSYRMTATSDNGIVNFIGNLSGEYRNSVELRFVAGTGNVNIYRTQSTANTIASVTSECVRYAASIGVATGAGDRTGVLLLSSGDSIDIRFIQSEEVTDQSNQAPSEYVDPDTNYGANVDGVRYFATENNNYVDANGVVRQYGADGLGINVYSEPFDTISGDWIDNGDGTYTCTGTAGSHTLTKLDTIETGKNYQSVVRITDYSGGSIRIYHGASNSDVFSGNGDQTYIHVGGGDTSFYVQATSNFIGTIEVHHIKQYNANAGAAITDIAGLLVEEESENIEKYSNDLTNWFASGGAVAVDHNTISFSTSSSLAEGPTLTSATGTNVAVSAYLWCDSGTELARIGMIEQGVASNYSPDLVVTTTKKRFVYIAPVGGTGYINSIIRNATDAQARTIHCEGFQVENGKSFATSPIPTSGAAATRLADLPQVAWPTGLVNDFVVNCDVQIPYLPQTQRILDNRTGTTNGWSIHQSSVVNRISFTRGTDLSGQTTINHDGTYVGGEPTSLKYRVSSTQGADGWVNNVIGFNNSITEDINSIRTNILIGHNYQGLQYINGTIRNVNVINGDLYDEEMYLLGNDDPWAGMSLDFQAFSNPSDLDVDVGIGNVAVDWASGGYVWNGSVYEAVAPDTVVRNVQGEAQYYPEATNVLIHSRDLSQWTDIGTPDAAQNQIGVDGVANKASIITDDNPSGSEYSTINTTIPADTNTNTYSMFIQKDGDESRFPAILVRQQVGGTDTYEFVWLNTKTGATTTSYPIGGGIAALEVVNVGGWWRVLISIVNANNTAFNVRVYPAYGTIFGTPSDAVGSIIVDSCEIHLNKTIAEVRDLPPIFTEGGAVTMDRTDYSFDIANHNQDNGIWVCDIEADVALSTTTGSIIGLASSTTSIMYFRGGENAVQTYDGTTGAVKTNLAVASTKAQVATIYHAGDALFNINAVGVSKGNTAAYDGSMSGAITYIGILKNNVYPIAISNLRRYSITSYIQGNSYIYARLPTLMA